MHFDIKPRYTLNQHFAKQSSTMKISTKAVARMAMSSPPKKAILPLVPDTEVDPLDKKNSVVYELRTVPNDNTSAKYKKTARIIKGDETVRTLIQWYKDLHPILHGLNVTTFNSQIAIIRTMTVGTVCSTFDNIVDAKRKADQQEKANAAGTAAQQAYTTALNAYNDQQNLINTGVLILASGTLQWTNGTAAPVPALLAQPNNNVPQQQYEAVMNQDKTNFGEVPHVMECVQQLLRDIMPRKILQRIKRYIRRDCRKPATMKVREYSQLLFNLNEEELPCLPPSFKAENSLSQDEIIDILLYGTPKSWQKEMDRQGFDPLEKELKDIVEFMENLEEAEGFDGTTVSNSKNNKKPTSSGKKSVKFANSPNDANEYCMLHGQGNHSTENCHTLKAEAKKLKERKGSNSGNKSSGKKDWSKKASDSKKNTAKELHVLVKKAVQAELKASDNKRKASKGDDDDDVMMMDSFNIEDFSYAEDGEITNSTEC